MNMPPHRLQELIERQRTMTKAKEPVTFLWFGPDANLEREYTDVRMVYRFADGSLEINHLGRRRAFQAGDRVVAFGGQRMPCRRSAKLAIFRIVAEANEARRMSC